jgi:hypothetical protein
VPEPGEKHGLGEGRAISPLREKKRSGARGALARDCLAGGDETGRKLVQKWLRFPLDFATYRWVAALSLECVVYGRLSVLSITLCMLQEFLQRWHIVLLAFFVRCRWIVLVEL